MRAILAILPIFALLLGTPLKAQTDPGDLQPELVAGSNGFALDLFRRLRDPQANLVVSPASVSAAISFAYRGAAGDTARELRGVLHFPYDPALNLRAYGAVLDGLPIAAKGRELRGANALWVRAGLPFDPSFIRDMQAYARTGLHQTGFTTDPEASRIEINGWVGEATKGKIPDLLAPHQVTAATQAVLVNALHFKGDWAVPFPTERTQPHSFTAIDGTRTVIPLMTQKRDFRVVRRDGTSAISLPYAGHEISMIVVLPDHPRRLTAFEDRLTSARLARWLAELDEAEPRDTLVTLPRMKLRWNGDLVPQLVALGAPTAFSNEADYSGMVKIPEAGDTPDMVGLKIGAVVHAATFDVDEAGSEAAAATTAAITLNGLRRPAPPPPFIFRADKPFLFLLRDHRSGMILFMGRYARPER